MTNKTEKKLSELTVKSKELVTETKNQTLLKTLDNVLVQSKKLQAKVRSAPDTTKA